MLKIVILPVALAAAAIWAAPELVRVARTGAPAPVKAAKVEDRSGSVTLRADPDGHFRADATIGGRRAPMLVDTGATVVALSYEQGEALGLVDAGDRFDVAVSTANGAVGAKRVVLRDVRVGSIVVPDVQALVLTRGAMRDNLLGMSFLNRLRRVEATRDRLVLER